MSLFSKNLRFLRKKGNHKQEEISILFNKRANTIGNWENQKSEPSLMELIKLGEYFNISTQALLHTDLEREFIPGEPEPGTTNPSEKTRKSYPIQESFSTIAQEGNPDAFWLILRELRSVSDKLDILASGLTASSQTAHSDKSSH